MKRCRLKLIVPCIIEFRVRPGEEDSAEDLIEKIGSGYTPTWVKELIKRNLQFTEVEVDDYEMLGHEPAPDEELNFDY